VLTGNAIHSLAKIELKRGRQWFCFVLLVTPLDGVETQLKVDGVQAKELGNVIELTIKRLG